LNAAVNIAITPAAEKFIRRMIRFGNVPPDGGFRLEVEPGGCSGLDATFDTVSAPLAGDAVLKHNGLNIFLPAESRLLLEGVTIDCVDSPTQSGFVFHDPKSSAAACGTASSPTVELVSLATFPAAKQ
jgi:iron-sulfur cluster assembly accessory protein